MSDYINQKKTILVIRRLGGVGDILMTRPIFKAIKQKNPSVDVHYSLPSSLMPLVSDSQYIDAIIPLESMDEVAIGAYRWHGDITRACIEHEVRFRGRVHVQRTDLWARHLGIEVLDHSEHFRFTHEEMAQAEEAILGLVGTLDNLFFVAPMSADPRRNIPREQVMVAVDWARKQGMRPVLVHGARLPEYEDMPQLFGHSLRTWMAMATKARMAITTDTGAMHLFGYLGVPTAAMHCYTSGKVVPMHYPTVVSYQLHRDNQEHAMPCVPCYDWGSCPYLKQDNNPVLKCVRDIPAKMVVDALEQAAASRKEVLNFSVVEHIEQKDRPAPSMELASFSRQLGQEVARTPKPLIPTHLEIDMKGANELDAMVACGMASAIKSRHPGTALAAINVDSSIVQILQLCPFLTIDNSKSHNSGATTLSIKAVSEHKAGWLVAMDTIVGIPSDGSAGLSGCSPSMRREMHDLHGEKIFELRDVDGEPEMNVPDKVWINPSWNWEKKLACARLARNVVTDKPSFAFACASLGIPVKLLGVIPQCMAGMAIQR